MKPKLMYVISEDWFFYSHFFDRALAARDAGYDVVVMTRERAHGQKIRAAGIRLLPVNFSRRSINPVNEFRSLLSIYLAYRREGPAAGRHLAAPSRFFVSRGGPLFFPRHPALTASPATRSRHSSFPIVSPVL